MKQSKKYICLCPCHRDGVTMIHFIGCCKYTGEKYISHCGIVDVKRYRQIIIKENKKEGIK